MLRRLIVVVIFLLFVLLWCDMATVDVPWGKLGQSPKDDRKKVESSKDLPKEDVRVYRLEDRLEDRLEVPEVIPGVVISEGISHKCPLCGEFVENARFELGFYLCKKCSPQVEVPKVIDFSQSTSGWFGDAGR